jgi:Protein of unknown function (DUF2442)
MARRWKSPSNAQILAQIPAAVLAEERAAAVEMRAERAWYDADVRRVMMELTNGCIFGFPPEMEPEIESFTDEMLAGVRVLPGGEGLMWDGTGAAVSVPGFFAGEHRADLPIAPEEVHLSRSELDGVIEEVSRHVAETVRDDIYRVFSPGELALRERRRPYPEPDEPKD